MQTRCRFIQYMPKNSHKLNIKSWLATDMQSNYLLNGFPYLGKDEKRTCGRAIGEHATFCLMEPYYNTGRNMSMDNFCSSLKLVKQMINAVINCVGRINSLKREIPHS